MRILIALATFNRPVITEICLNNLQAVRSRDVRLAIYDDASTAYNQDQLARFADDVVRPYRNGGIERSRAKAMRDFVYRYTDFDLLYFTDNDTFHDPNFVEVLRTLFKWQQTQPQMLPVSLYNTVFHNQSDNILDRNDVVLVSRTIPGVSQCYTREMARIIVDALDRSPDLEFQYGWDYIYTQLLQRPCLFTQTSFVEHFARDRQEGGMHCQASAGLQAALADFERDRAINPTPPLVQVRDRIIRTILGLDEHSEATLVEREPVLTD